MSYSGSKKRRSLQAGREDLIQKWSQTGVLEKGSLRWDGRWEKGILEGNDKGW